MRLRFASSLFAALFLFGMTACNDDRDEDDEKKKDTYQVQDVASGEDAADTGGAEDAGAPEDASRMDGGASDVEADTAARDVGSDAVADTGGAVDAGDAAQGLDTAAADVAADVSDAGPDGAEADSGGPMITDPFNPKSCSGTAWTSSAALNRLGSKSSEKLDSKAVMERSRTCTSSGCGPWSTPKKSDIRYLTWSGGVRTHYKTLQTDTTLVLYKDAGKPKLSVRHDTHLRKYPSDHDKGIVFGFPPKEESYPRMRAYNFNPQGMYRYRDLENYIGRDARLYASPNCARFESVEPGRGKQVTKEYVAVYRF